LRSRFANFADSIHDSFSPAVFLAVKSANAQKSEEKKEVVVVNDEVTKAMDMAAHSGVLTGEDLAAQLRSQADALFKEAKRLREQAEELSPTKKVSVKKAEIAKA
jgi:hypothetical protein